MMFLLTLALAVDGPVGVDVAGMKPQLDIAMATAARERWWLVCRGRSGDMTVLRFALPAGTTDKQVLIALGDRAPYVSTSSIFFDPDRLTKACDAEPPRVGGLPSQAIVAGAPGKLEGQLALARSCGFARASLRPYRPDDRMAGGEAGPDWQTLDAGEDIMARYGPLICYAQLSRRMGLQASK